MINIIGNYEVGGLLVDIILKVKYWEGWESSLEKDG